MIVEWQPDTCSCVLIYEVVGDSIMFKDYVQKCELHKDLDGFELFNAVVNHNKMFNLIKLDDDPKRDLDKKVDAKRVEKAKWGVAVVKKREEENVVSS